ncbi:MAG TPA: MBL fold metallo-hydrolase [Gaiellaceae bacterium]
MKLTVVGCSPAWPNPGGAHSGYLVEDDGDRLLLDCGPGVLARLRSAEAWPTLDAIVLTHFHLDHCGDLVPWLWGHLMGPAAGRTGPELWLPPDGRLRLDELAPLVQWEAVFPLHEYDDAATFDAAGFHITPQRVVHYDEPTWGLRVERAGRVLAYSADTASNPALVELARNADVFLCEATLAEPEEGQRGHLTADDARAVFLESGASRLLLTHRAAELPLEELVYEGFELEL